MQTTSATAGATKAPFDFQRISARSHYHYTDRLALRPLAVSDTWPLLQAFSLPAFNQNLLWTAPKTPAQALGRVEDMLAAAHRGDIAATSVVRRDTGEWVGVVRYFPALIDNLPCPAIEGGLWLHPKFWHERLGIEMGALTKGAIFIEQPDLQMFISRVSKDNRAANRLVADLGLRIIGEGITHREDGTEMPIWHHAITRIEWQQRGAPNQVVARDR